MDTVKFSRISTDGSLLVPEALEDKTIRMWNIKRFKIFHKHRPTKYDYINRYHR